MTETYYNGDRFRFAQANFIAVHMEVRDLYKETSEEFTESMQVLNLKGGIRDTTGMENPIEAARTSISTNNTF